MSEQYDKGKFILDFLNRLGIDVTEALDAIDDENIERSYQLLKANPEVTKEECMQLLGLEGYIPNTIPHPYRNYGDGNFDPEKLFRDIQSFVADGNDINVFFENESVLYGFLDYYYQLIVYSPIIGDENEYKDDGGISSELLLPLSKRAYNIKEKMNWMLEHGADPNAGGEWLPLMPPVAYLDFAMTEFLLNHGANAHYVGSDDGDIPFGCGNYYIDDLDITALNYSLDGNATKAIFDQILKIATLFANRGVTDVGGHCLSIDGKTRSINLTQAKVKY